VRQAHAAARLRRRSPRRTTADVAYWPGAVSATFGALAARRELGGAPLRGCPPRCFFEEGRTRGAGCQPRPPDIPNAPCHSSRLAKRCNERGNASISPR
jgi:hypothetical protein